MLKFMPTPTLTVHRNKKMADVQGNTEEAIMTVEAQGIVEGPVTSVAEKISDKDNLDLDKMDFDESPENNLNKMDCDENPESKDNLNKTDSKESAESKDKKDSKEEEDAEMKAKDELRKKESKMKLKRFCCLGSFEPVYIHLRGYIKVNEVWPTLKKLVSDVNDTEFLPLMREVLHEVPLVRRDEALFVYAAYLASSVEMDCKTALRIAFPVLIRNEDDLFLFCKYTSLINKQEKRKCFSRTVRRAIKAWYENQPVDTIRSMWISHRGLHGFTHCILMKLCHISDDNIGSAEVASCFFKSCTKLLKEAEVQVGTDPKQSTSSSSNQPPHLDKENPGKRAQKELVKDCTLLPTPIVGAELSSDSENVEEAKQPTASTYNETEIDAEIQEEPAEKKLVRKSTASPTPTSIILAVSKLRTTQKKHDAIKIIRKFKLSYSQVPGHWLRFPVIMEAVLPTMSYLQILKCWRKMARYNHFENNPKILKICKKMLENVELAKSSGIYPFHILTSRHNVGIDRLSNLTPEKLKAAHLDYLDKLYKDSFHWPADSGNLRMHITLNLQTNYKKKLLKNYKKLSYQDACFALSFGYYKRAKNVEVFHWCEDKLMVKPIPFTNDCTTEMAFNTYNAVVNDKNNQRLIAPLMNGMNRNQFYDVFLCIVPTAGRGHPKQKSDFLCSFLDRYREKTNPNARLVILDLLKFNRPSMTYSDERWENILEICGLDDHTNNLIHNFATHRFD